MAQIKQITGLMATPTRGYTAGFRASVPTVDNTVSKTVTKAIGEANDAVFKLARYEREEAIAREKGQERLLARSSEIMAQRRAAEAKEALRAKQEQDKAALKAQEEARKEADNIAVAMAVSGVTTSWNAAVFGKNGWAYTPTASVVDSKSWAEQGGSFEAAVSSNLTTLLNKGLENVPAHLRGEVALKLQPTYSSLMAATIKKGGEALRDAGQQAYEANYDNMLTSVGFGGGDVDSLKADAVGKAKLNGKNVEDPAVLASIDADVRKDVSSSRLTAIGVFVEQGNLTQAEALFSATVADKLFVPTDMQKAVKQIGELRTSVNGKNAGAVALAAYQLETSFEGKALRATGQVVDAEGAKAVAEAMNNAGGDTEAALAIMLFGEERMDALFDKAEKSKTNWRAGLTEKEASELSSSLRRFNADTAGSTNPTDQTIGRLIRQSNPGLNEEGMKIAKDTFAAEAERQKIEYDNLKFTAAQALITGMENGNDISALAGVKTTPFSKQEKDKLFAYQARLRLGSAGNYSNPFVMARLADPKKLAGMSDFEFIMLKTDAISSEDFAYLTYLRQYGRDNGKDLKGPSYSWEAVTRAVKDYASLMNVKLTPEQVRIYASEISKNVFRQSRMLGNAMPEEDIRRLVEDTFGTMVVPSVKAFFASDATALIGFDEDDYDSEVSDVLTKCLRLPEGTKAPEGALNAAYASLFALGEYDIPLDVLTDDQRKWVHGEIEKINKDYANKMSYNDEVRAFILLKHGDRTRIERLTR